MTSRTDVVVNFAPSPRIAEIAAPSVEIIMQDVVDTLRVLEDDFIGMSSEKLLDASGKQDLGGGVLVGITVALQDTQLAFEGRTTPAETGTVTTGSGTASGKPLRYTFVDTAADFVTANVQRGSLVINYTDNSIAEVYRVISATELETKVLVNGIGNTYDISDVYHVHNITQVRAIGGNLTAVDSNGDPLASGVLPTAFTQVLVQASSSATLLENATSTEIAAAVWNSLVANFTTSGSFGEFIGKKLLTVVKFLGLK